MDFIVKHKAIIIPLLAGLALGQFVIKNEDLFQGYSNFFMTGCILVYAGIYRLITNDFSRYRSTLFNLLTLLIGLVFALAPILIRPCDVEVFAKGGIRGVRRCECIGIKYDFGEIITILQREDILNYCVGMTRDSIMRDNF